MFPDKIVVEECLLEHQWRSGLWSGEGSIDAPTKGNQGGKLDCIRWRGIYLEAGSGRRGREFLGRGETGKGFTI